MSEIHLNREIAELLGDEIIGYRGLKPYSTSIGAAWLVMNHLKDYGWTIGYNHMEYIVKCENLFDISKRALVFDSNAAKAICLAALQVEGKNYETYL